MSWTATASGRAVAALGALLLALGLAYASPAATAAADEHDVEITLLHDTHLHGTFGDEETSGNRLMGANRYGTAAEVAVAVYDSAPDVVLATGRNFPDALAASALAGALDAPILLTEPDRLPQETEDALDDLDAESVHIVGGTAAVSADVEDNLDTLGYDTERHAGADRYETAAEIARDVGDITGIAPFPDTELSTAIVATGENFPDALAGGSLGFFGPHPILLVQTDSVPSATAAVLEDHEIGQVVILGGTAAVSTDVQDTLEDITGHDAIRLGGADRHETATLVADAAVEFFEFPAADVIIANGWQHFGVDALAGAPLGGVAQAPILLVRQDRLSSHTETWLGDNADAIDTVWALGGTAVVADATLEAAIHAAHAAGLVNIGRYMALAEERKDAHEHALFIGNGDDIAPSLLSGVFRGQHMIDALNVSPIDINTFGNHEFDYGPERLRELIQASEFPWVTANVVDIDAGEPFATDLGVQTYEAFEFDGVTVGVTGLGPEGMATITSLGEDTEQVPAVDAMPGVVQEMRDDGVDIVVVASHLSGSDARDLAADVDGIDVIVGDHDAEVLDEPEVINDTIVSFVGDEFDHLGELTLQITGGEIDDWQFLRHDLADLDIRPHPAVQDVVFSYLAELDAELNVVIGERAQDWDTTRGVVRQEETAIGNFIADALREWGEADVGIQNSGGIRGDRVFPAGDVTRRDVAEILPFENYTVKASLSGETLLEVLEHSVASFEEEAGEIVNRSGQFLQVSGLTMDFDPTAPVGSRVSNVTVGGTALDTTADYTLATNDFTLGGGDAFDMLAEDAEVLIDQTGGRLLSEFIMEVVENRGLVDTPVEDRINRVD